jgi:hypothetical protein
VLTGVALFVSARAAQAQTDCYVLSLTYSMKLCLSDHGNVIHFESPTGIQQIASGEEGYILCDATTGAVYHDTGTVAEGFGAPTIIEPNGLNSFPFTVVRTTLDGQFTLSQTFTRGRQRTTGDRELIILTDVANNTSTSHQLQVTRWVNADVNGSPAHDIFGRTRESVLAWESVSEVGDSGNGLEMTSLAWKAGTLPQAAVEEYPGTRTACGATSLTTPTQGTDLVGELTHSGQVGPMGQGKKGSDHLTNFIVYRRF